MRWVIVGTFMCHVSHASDVNCVVVGTFMCRIAQAAVLLAAHICVAFRMQAVLLLTHLCATARCVIVDTFMCHIPHASCVIVDTFMCRIPHASCVDTTVQHIPNCTSAVLTTISVVANNCHIHNELTMRYALICCDHLHVHKIGMCSGILYNLGYVAINAMT